MAGFLKQKRNCLGAIFKIKVGSGGALWSFCIFAISYIIQKTARLHIAIAMAVQVVSSATFISTMLSIVTLPVLLWKLHPLSS